MNAYFLHTWIILTEGWNLGGFPKWRIQFSRAPSSKITSASLKALYKEKVQLVCWLTNICDIPLTIWVGIVVQWVLADCYYCRQRTLQTTAPQHTTNMYTHVRVYMHSHARTHTHTHTHTHTQTHTCRHTQTHMHTYTHTHTHTNRCMHIHMRAHTHTHSMHTCTS